MNQNTEGSEGSRSEIEAFGLTFMGRLVQAMLSETKPDSSGKQLEQLLPAILQFPWLKTLAVDLLAKLEALSDKQWSRKVIGFCVRMADLLSEGYIAKGEIDPFQYMEPVEKARLVARIFGWSKLRWFISDVRSLCRDALEEVSQGRSNESGQDLTGGLFTKDLANGLDIMNTVLYLSGGKTLVDQIEAAAQLVKETMDSQMALMAAMEIAEKQYKWTLNPKEDAFQNTWNSMKSRLVSSIWIHELKIPGTYLAVENGSYKDYVDEELALLQESIFEELVKRIKNDPSRVVADAMAGKLQNSLKMAALNDLRDRIKTLRRQNKDVLKEVFLSIQEDTGTDRDLVEPDGQILDKTNQAFSSAGSLDPSFEEMIEGLDDDEKKVLTLIYNEDIPGKEIAKQMQKSSAWVTKTKKKAIEKLRQEFNERFRGVP